MIDGSRHLGYVLKRFPRISETFVASELIELAHAARAQLVDGHWPQRVRAVTLAAESALAA